ncbi:hypothetical protein HAX54_029203 [Datura stramonium]|uniref:Uncharacterized protein n=1 Tax=Datura stramonium TaxID=4076 RepID=A0ABS8V6W0_DATST|nr:hypothetical protein [Datura stramonium]
MFYVSTSCQCVVLALVSHSIEKSLIDGTCIAWRYKETRRFEAYAKCCVDDPTHLGDDLALYWFKVVTFYHTIDPTSLGNDMVDLCSTFDENICSIELILIGDDMVQIWLEFWFIDNIGRLPDMRHQLRNCATEGRKHAVKAEILTNSGNSQNKPAIKSAISQGQAVQSSQSISQLIQEGNQNEYARELRPEGGEIRPISGQFREDLISGVFSPYPSAHLHKFPGVMKGQNSGRDNSNVSDAARADVTARDQCHLGPHPMAHPYNLTAPHSTHPKSTNMSLKHEPPRAISGDSGVAVPEPGTQNWFNKSMGNHSQALEMQKSPFNLEQASSNLRISSSSNWTEVGRDIMELEFRNWQCQSTPNHMEMMNLQKSPSNSAPNDSNLAFRVSSTDQLTGAGAPVAGKWGNQCQSMENTPTNP